MKKTMIICLIILIAITTSLYAQKRTFTASRITGTAPVLDGILNDSIWETANWSKSFTEWEPYNGKKASQDTEFSIVYDDNYIYVAIKAFDIEPDKVARIVSRKDSDEGDSVEIQFDSYNDKRVAFIFNVNAAGVKSDFFLFDDDGIKADFSWDPIWHTEVSLDKSGWTAEMRIPFTQLRFADRQQHTWGLQVVRKHYRKKEFSLWQPVDNKLPNYLSHLGQLTGIENIKPGRRIEFIPYYVGKYQNALQSENASLNDPDKSSFVSGIDLKVGLTNDLNLDVTVNPDFGQVEADPSEVNLTTFETFFPEKRQFFIEGNNILDFQMHRGGQTPFSSDKLFHSRRIGRPSRLGPDADEDDFSNIPENVSILAAAKLTGRTRNGFSIGILESITENEKADFLEANTFKKAQIEPLTSYFVSRLQKDDEKGNLRLGGIFTATNRRIDSDMTDYLHDAAYTAGVDVKKYWKNKTYILDVTGSFSHVSGSKEAVLRTQKASQRYFQRPDAEHLTLDPNKTGLSGHGGAITFARSGNSSWGYESNFIWRSPGFELNDIGFLRSTDEIMQLSSLQYTVWNPVGIFNKVNLSATGWKSWNFGGETLYGGGTLSYRAAFKNFWTLSGYISRFGKRLSAEMLRGGPSFLLPARVNTSLNLSTNQNKKTALSMGMRSSFAEGNNDAEFSISTGVSLRLNNSSLLSLEPMYAKNINNLQYLTAINSTPDKRYILGRLNQKTFALTMRLNYSITPNLTVQYYGQPFVSAGAYSNFAKVLNPRAENLGERTRQYTADEVSFDAANALYKVDENQERRNTYSFDRPDFNAFQFNSNLVVRWEYKPGSVVSVIWTQNRNGTDSTGIFSLNDNFNDLFRYHPDNVLLIKVNRWFPF